MSGRAIINERIRSKRPERVSINDALSDGELAGIAKAKAANGNGNQPERYCDCLELLVNGKRVPCPPQHDCEYTRQRSELVPVAVALTNANVPNDSARWARVFNTEMERLARPLLSNQTASRTSRKPSKTAN